MSEILANKKLEKARDIIFKKLAKKIATYYYLSNHNNLKIIFHDGSILYIGYNNHKEYAYQLIFSKDPLDRIRFDCMDKQWDVKTSPHHFHPRYSKSGIRSPMKGNPEEDIIKLVDLILEGKLENKEIEFN